MEQVSRQMLQMLKSELTGEPLPADFSEGMTEEDWNRLLSLSRHHDVAHLLGDLIAREELPVPEAPKKAFDEVFCEAILRAQLFEEEQKKIGSVFQKAQIRFLPLKGAVIRQLYPEPWMRTSCDIDILIRKEDIKRAKKLLIMDLNYRFEKQAYHELSLYSPSGVHLELHFSIEEHTETLDRVLKDCWDYAEPVQEGSCCYRFQSAFLVFHSVAHAAYHFKVGGCGIRPLIDQFLLERKIVYDRSIYKLLIEKANLTVFEEQFTRLWQVWFSDRKHDDLTYRMETYILSAGVYGSTKNHETIRLIRRGRVGNFLCRIWLPYNSLIIKYPSLKGKRILQPLYEIRRWFTLFKKGKMRTIRREVKTNLGVDSEQKEQVKSLLNDLDLPA